MCIYIYIYVYTLYMYTLINLLSVGGEVGRDHLVVAAVERVVAGAIREVPELRDS